jgi:hypothetical protein
MHSLLRHLAVLPFAVALILVACGAPTTTRGTGTGTTDSSSASSTSTTPGSSTTSSTGNSTTTDTGTSTTSGGTTTTSSVPATPTPCQRVYPAAPPPDGIPMPSGTLVSSDGNGAGGEIVYLACTPGATADAITSYLNNTLAGAGWHLDNPSTDHNEGCTNVRWVKGHNALDWSDPTSMLPYWQIFLCDKINQT